MREAIRRARDYCAYVQQLRRELAFFEECAERLAPEQLAVLAVLMDEEGEKIVRIAERLGVSFATAYRRKDGCLWALGKLLEGKRVRDR